MSAAIESFKFEAEVQQVLHLVIHSLYSNRDVFLRELVSNASDACDKLRFEALQNPELMADASDLAIDIDFDAKAASLTVRDNGIGMSREELIENLGMIARSGTRKFLENLSAGQQADANLIGQFGVGFYSAFIVADQVNVISRRAGTEAGWCWRSDGSGEYTLEPIAKAPRGTSVTLHLKDDAKEYLEVWKMRSLIHAWSDHIAFPIRMPAAATDKSGDQREVVNQASALWTRPKAELDDAAYQAFYKHVSHDFNEALSWTHNRVEGNQNFTSLLYLPQKAPFDFQFNRDERSGRGLRLYVKRVFIMDAADKMLPAYLRFVRGVVDSDDLPLNISRELLQTNRQVEKLKSALTKRVLDMIERVAAEASEKYDGFWREFGGLLKEGLVEDHGNRDRLAKLLRFASTLTGQREDLVALDDYVQRMKPGQEAIYFITADGWNAARHSPQLEALRNRGVEVLLLHERIDEWMIGSLTRHADKPLRNVAKGSHDFSKIGEAPDAPKSEAGSNEAAVAALKTALGDRVREVRESTRLVESPSCLVLEEHDMALHMQRLLRSAGHEVADSKPILEVNLGHALLRRFKVETDTSRKEDLALLLFEQAQLAEGAPLEDPAAFVARTNRLILSTF